MGLARLAWVHLSAEPDTRSPLHRPPHAPILSGTRRSVRTAVFPRTCLPMLRTLALLIASAGLAFAMTADEACPCPSAAAGPGEETRVAIATESEDAGSAADAVPPCHRPAAVLQPAEQADATAAGEDVATTDAEQAHAHGDTPCPCEHDDDNPTCCCPGCPAAHGDPSTSATLHLEAALPRAPELRAALHAQPSPAAGPRAPDAHLRPPPASLPAVRPPPPPPDPTTDLTIQLQVFRV